MKFRMDVIPLGSALNHTFQSPGSTNMDEQTHEVESTLALLTLDHTLKNCYMFPENT